MYPITEFDLLELETELSEIKFVSEGIDIRAYFNAFKSFAKLTPDRLALQLHKLAVIPAKLKRAVSSGSKIAQDKIYFAQCKEFIQSKTYFSERDVDKLIKETSKILDTYKPSKSTVDVYTVRPMAWAMTTLSIAVFSKNNPNKRLSVPEAVAYVKSTCRNIKNKISAKAQTKAGHLFFIFLLVFLINLTFFLFIKQRALPRYIAISSVLAYIFYLDYFLKNDAKQGDKEVVKESGNILEPYSNKISSVVQKLGTRIIDPEFFTKNAVTIAKSFKSVIPKTANPKVVAMKFITTAEEYIKENSDMTAKEISGVARQITKYIISLFDISQRVTILLPISWLAIIYIVVVWKQKNPDKKITKQIILSAAKEYFYKANVKWSKYQAKTKEQYIMTVLAAPYLLLSLLMFAPPIRDYFVQGSKEAYGININTDAIKFLYSIVAAVYMIEAITVATQTMGKGE